MNNINIQNELELLTESQKLAVNWGKGPLVIVAGPGSGKTKVLTLRIAKLLEESKDENFRILGLTFTNKAADEVRDRVYKLTNEENKRLHLGTFHGFCASVLRNHGSYLNVSPNFSIYSDSRDLNQILKEVIHDLVMNNEIEENENTNYLSIIQYLLRNLHDPRSPLDSIIKNKEIKLDVEKVYKKYWDTLTELNILDFDTLIFKTYLLFNEYPFISKHYRTMFPYICVDEFQDTNLAQYKLLESLNNKNIFAVADDDQLIFQWNGASNKRLNEFIIDFDASVIQLTDNFRCPPAIVDLANKLISNNSGRLKNKEISKSVRSKLQDPEVIKIKKFTSLDDEISWITNTIVNNNHYNSTAVIARSNKMLSRVYEKLKRENVPVIMTKRKDQFESPQLSLLHNLLKLANKRNDARYLGQVIDTFEYIIQSPTEQKIDPEEIVAWSEGLHGDYLKGFVKAIETKCNIEDEIFLKSLDLKLVEKKDFIGFFEDAFNWYESLKGNSRLESFKELYLEEKDTWKQLLGNVRYKVGTSEQLTLTLFLHELEINSKHKIVDEKNSVQCLTIHSAKGKEFDNVYLIGLVEDELPSFMSIKQGSEAIEEERRSCFVAITRAVKSLTITFATNYYGFNKVPSRFLREMDII